MACRGRNTVVNLTKGLLEQILEGEDVVSFEWNGEQEVRQYRFAGASTDVGEEHYKNVSFTLTLNHRSPAVTTFVHDVLARGRRLAKFDVKINTEYTMENGEVARIRFAKCLFSNPGVSSPGRMENNVTVLNGFCEIAEPLVMPV